MNLSNSVLFQMKTKVCLKYFVNDCRNTFFCDKFVPTNQNCQFKLKIGTQNHSQNIRD